MIYAVLGAAELLSGQNSGQLALSLPAGAAICRLRLSEVLRAWQRGGLEPNSGVWHSENGAVPWPSVQATKGIAHKRDPRPSCPRILPKLKARSGLGKLSPHVAFH